VLEHKKKDVADGFHLSAKGTLPIGPAMTSMNLLISWHLSLGHLLEEDFDF
jgi:hypothetical protein